MAARSSADRSTLAKAVSASRAARETASSGSARGGHARSQSALAHVIIASVRVHMGPAPPAASAQRLGWVGQRGEGGGESRTGNGPRASQGQPAASTSPRRRRPTTETLRGPHAPTPVLPRHLRWAQPPAVPSHRLDSLSQRRMLSNAASFRALLLHASLLWLHHDLTAESAPTLSILFRPVCCCVKATVELTFHSTSLSAW